MSVEDVIRAWKDTDYRANLSGEQLALLPESPVGVVEIPQELLDEMASAGPVSLTHSCETIVNYSCDTSSHDWSCYTCSHTLYVPSNC